MVLKVFKGAEEIMFCKHDWEVKDKTMMYSRMEVAYSCGLKPETSVDADYFLRKAITIMSCKKCGKLKKFVETN